MIEKIRFYKTELSVYKDPNKFRTMTDNDIEKIYKELKKVFKGYQEERIRRNVMKDLNAIVEIDFSDDEESQYEFKT